MPTPNAARRDNSPGHSRARRPRRWLRLVARLLSFDCNRIFYHPDRRDRGSPADEGVAYEDVFFAGADGLRLHGWFMPAGPAPARGTVLHIHGNAANITGHYAFVHWLPASGYNVLTFDYRGFGRSEGRPTRRGTVHDAHAALDYLRGRGDVDPDRIVVFGQSIGGGVAAVLAAERRDQIRAVALDSVFTSHRDIVRFHVHRNLLLTALAWWLPRLVANGLDAIDHVAEIAPLPIFFIHGRSDRITPWTGSQRLCDTAGRPKDIWLIDGMDHTEVWEEQPQIARTRLLDFFDRALGNRT